MLNKGIKNPQANLTFLTIIGIEMQHFNLFILP